MAEDRRARSLAGSARQCEMGIARVAGLPMTGATIEDA